MIDVQLYRARIGVFALASSVKSAICLDKKKGMQARWMKWKKNKRKEQAGIGQVFIFMTCLAFVCVIILIVLKLVLKVAGDIETNPGPYEILRSVQGSFNQGSVAMFGETAGRQCACNALFVVCWSLVRKISYWTTRDLDYILIQGDNLYKSLNKESFLSVDDLPREIHVFQYIVSIEMKAENLYDGVVF